jgi:anti-sigma factor RsiW
VDGELDLVRTLEVEKHLHTCPACTALYEGLQTLKSAVRRDSLRYTPSDRFQKQIQTALLHAEPKVKRPRLPVWLAIAASLAVATGLGWVLGRVGMVRRDDLVTRELVAGHIRSLMVDHLTDIGSADQHTVKPWFLGRVDFGPVVKDFTDKEYPLIGGRLDFLDNQSVAALVYEHGKHVINLFQKAATGEPDSKPTLLTRQGFQIIQWTRGGIRFWAISDLNGGDLQAFAELIQHASG